MQATFAESLSVLLPGLPSALAPPALLPDLSRLARALPPIPRGGFEVHLGTPPGVDVHHGIVAAGDEPQRLRTHLAATGATVHPAWQRVDDFLARWNDPASDLHDEITELVLELDQTPLSVDPLLPSVFFGFRQEPAPAPARYAVAQAALDVLPGSTAWSPWQPDVRRCFEACSPPSFVSHLGVMAGRRVPALRINVKRLQADSLLAYLRRVGWPGASAENALEEAAAMMARLQQFVDRITVCLDVGARVYPQIGFECILLKQPPPGARWAVFLDHLVERGWCLPHQRDALLDWPGYTTPLTTTVGWPASLISAELLQASDCFTAFQRGLSHVKVSYHPQRPVTAKAYLTFRHQWLQRCGAKQLNGAVFDG